MGVRVREEKPGTGRWYVYINWRGQRMARRVGSKRAGQALAVELEKLLAIADLYTDADEVSLSAALRRAIRDSRQVPEETVPTVGEYAKTWVSHNTGEDGWKKSTRAGYESLLSTYIVPWWGDVPLDEVSRRGVRDWIAHLRTVKTKRREDDDEGKPLSPKYLRNIAGALSSILSTAVDDELLADNPILNVGRLLPKVAKDRRPPKAWDRDQLRRILAAAREKSPRYFPMFVFLAETGVRIGEACGLHWGSLDLQQGQAIIEEARVRGEATSTKSRRYRTVPMTPELCDLLRAQRVRQAREALKKERPQPTHVFTSTRGTPVDQDNLRSRHWYRIVKAAEVPDFGLHGFRHTRASWWLMEGIDATTVSRRLGHGGIQITVDTYGHVIELQAEQDEKPLWRQEGWAG